MKVFRTLESYEKGIHPVVTIGTFDGLHLGHRKIIERVITEAGQAGGESVVLSFHPHPRLVLFPDDNPMKLLQTLEERIEMLDRIGVDKLLLIPFTKEFSRLTSTQFIRDILVKVVGIEKIIVGYDHHFGKNREGGISELLNGASEFSFAAQEIPAQQIDENNVSSTKIRNALLSGDVRTARLYLGYPYTFSGTVVQGQQLGRTLGYPTANIRPDDPLKLIPGEGVYLTEADAAGKTYYGMLNIGKKPTVGQFPKGIEVNLLGFDGDLYGQPITIRFLEFIREDKKFNSLDELIAAIDDDKKKCLALIDVLKH